MKEEKLAIYVKGKVRGWKPISVTAHLNQKQHNIIAGDLQANCTTYSRTNLLLTAPYHYTRSHCSPSRPKMNECHAGSKTHIRAFQSSHALCADSSTLLKQATEVVEVGPIKQSDQNPRWKEPKEAKKILAPKTTIGCLDVPVRVTTAGFR